MITQSIEKALINGRAWLKTYVLAGSQVGKIVVPDNNFIIITSITVQPFTNWGGYLSAPIPTCTEIDAVSTISVELSNQETDRTNFVVRNNWYLYQAPSGEFTLKNSEPQTFDTYLVRSKNVYIQVGLIPGANSRSGPSALDTGALINSQIPGDTAGLAGQLVLRDIVTTAGTIYAPAGTPDSGTSVVPGTPLFFNALPNFRDSDCVLDTNIFYTNIASPLVVVQYVVLNEQARKDFQ